MGKARDKARDAVGKAIEKVKELLTPPPVLVPAPAQRPRRR